MKTAFIILHYLNEEVTNRCVQSLLALDNIANNEIVIVDNASPNGSGKRLLDTYADATNIHVLLQEENWGFAKGNNVGYLYAKQQLDAKIMVVMNSDVYIYDKAFIAKTEQAFASTKADLIAPEIYAPFYKLYQNPYATQVLTLERTRKWYQELREHEEKINRPVIGACTILYSHWFERLYDFRESFRTRVRDPKLQYGVVPHGSCVIYGNQWTENEDIAFVPKTFFYGEEHILGYYAHQKNYTSCYVPELYVEHECGATRKHAFSKLTKENRFYYKQQVAAVKTLLDMMEADVQS